jgi:hypothetical protein
MFRYEKITTDLMAILAGAVPHHYLQQQQQQQQQ